MRTKMRWASPPTLPPSPPDLQSSTLRPLQVLPHTNYPSILPSTKSPLSFQQDDDDEQLTVIGGVKEYEAAVLDNIRVTGSNRRSYWNPSAETSADSSLSSSLSHQQQQGGHWLEEDKILPFKKRRILNLDYVLSNSTRTIVKNIGNARASRKCTKKIWADHVVNYKDDGLEWAGGARNVNNSITSCSSRRCRRINGHGWRCSQPSLVGYSMCEHHWELDKNRVTKKKKKKKKKKKGKKINCPCKADEAKFDQHHQPSSIEDFDDDHVIFKRRIVVKARSLSSLLS